MNTTTLRMIRNRDFIRDIKLKRGCDRCGYNKCSYALDFHHKNRENKKATINNLCKSLKNLKEIREEINKCQLLCANCHRETYFDIKRKKEGICHGKYTEKLLI